MPAYPVHIPAHLQRGEDLPKTMGQALAPGACRRVAKDLLMLHIAEEGMGTVRAVDHRGLKKGKMARCWEKGNGQRQESLY